MACLAGKIWRKHGTLECSGDDLEVKMGRQGDELGLVHPAMATQTQSDRSQANPEFPQDYIVLHSCTDQTGSLEAGRPIIVHYRKHLLIDKRSV